MCHSSLSVFMTNNVPTGVKTTMKVPKSPDGQNHYLLPPPPPPPPSFHNFEVS